MQSIRTFERLIRADMVDMEHSLSEFSPSQSSLYFDIDIFAEHCVTVKVQTLSKKRPTQSHYSHRVQVSLLRLTPFN